MVANVLEVARRLLVNRVKGEQSHASNGWINQHSRTWRYIYLCIGTAIKIIQDTNYCAVYEGAIYIIWVRCATLLRISRAPRRLQYLRSIPEEPDIQTARQSHL